VTAAELIDTVANVAALGEAGAPHEVVTRHWLRERRPSLNVLVADDSPTNRMLALRLLEKRGHRGLAVENGREAVEAVEKHDFDVVLMDMQMPELDGLGATAVIRDAEKETGGRVPIVALTAHAMESDRRRCLAAGMDGFLSKPFAADDLYATIEQLGRASGSVVAIDVVPPPIDAAEALTQVGGDTDFYVEVVAAFLGEYAEMAEALTAAFGASDMAAVAAAAHRLKGSLGSIAAHQAAGAAAELETVARDGDAVAAPAAWGRLRGELDRLEPELVAITATRGASLAT
jgi:CheY-like chemotaxis protein